MSWLTFFDKKLTNFSSIKLRTNPESRGNDHILVFFRRYQNFNSLPRLRRSTTRWRGCWVRSSRTAAYLNRQLLRVWCGYRRLLASRARVWFQATSSSLGSIRCESTSRKRSRTEPQLESGASSYSKESVSTQCGTHSMTSSRNSLHSASKLTGFLNCTYIDMCIAPQSKGQRASPFKAARTRSLSIECGNNSDNSVRVSDRSPHCYDSDDDDDDDSMSFVYASFIFVRVLRQSPLPSHTGNASWTLLVMTSMYCMFSHVDTWGRAWHARTHGYRRRLPQPTYCGRTTRHSRTRRTKKGLRMSRWGPRCWQYQRAGPRSWESIYI
jgi:hypothetical protein